MYFLPVWSGDGRRTFISFRAILFPLTENWFLLHDGRPVMLLDGMVGGKNVLSKIWLTNIYFLCLKTGYCRMMVVL
jgi:hypothetical protein